MAFELRLPKKVRKNGGVIIQYGLMNSKIVRDATSEGLLNNELNKEILDIYFEFGTETLKQKDIWKIPYIGSLKPGDYKAKYKSKGFDEEDINLNNL